MLILVTNDDGIGAPGIASLIAALKGVAEVVVIAPERERSAVGHAITMHKPLRANRVKTFGDNIRAWAVNGTPSDCVKLGIEALLDRRPDIVFSGINRGPNLGTDVLYSGTVSAAIEGAILGVPSAALSLASYEEHDFDVAADFAVSLAENIYKHSLAEDTLLNVNVPALYKSDIKGVRVTSLGTRKYKNSFEMRTDPRGLEYYWMSGQAVDEFNSEDCDICLVDQGFITITPIHFDLTRFDMINRLKEWKFEF
jgi:5'-nucleotidase